MDPLTLTGIVLGLLALIIGMILEGTNPTALIAIPAFLIVIVPTMLIAFAGFAKTDLSTIISGAKRAFLGGSQSSTDSIDTVVRFADKARREGLLSLESSTPELEDDFLRTGINLAIDGTDPEELRAILEAEIEARKQENALPAKFFMDMGGYAPTLGILGAVIGLIHVLGHLEDPTTAGQGIATAFIATLYGVGSANLIFIPIGNKLKRMASAETHHLELLLEGILSIQSGSNPRVLQQKLLSYLPPNERDAAVGREQAA